MRITIATGIYPPEIGGPAEYARRLFETMLIQNQEVSVATYGDLKRLPTGLRHIAFFFSLCFEAAQSDYLIVLDTFSAALPAAAFSWLFGKKMVVRVGGDFLWESYVERTKEPILLSRFYREPRNFSFKEGVIFLLTKWIFRRASRVVFTTSWQRGIMAEPYGISLEKTVIIENYFPPGGEKSVFSREDDGFIFLSPSRDRVIKNKENVEWAFRHVAFRDPRISLDTKVVSRDTLMEKIGKCYAVIAASLSEVSPNIVTDAIERGTPVIVTADTGMRHRFEGMVEFVNPLSRDDIARGIERLLDGAVYDGYRQKIRESSHTHSWNEITQEFLDIYSIL